MKQLLYKKKSVQKQDKQCDSLVGQNCIEFNRYAKESKNKLQTADFPVFGKMINFVSKYKEAHGFNILTEADLDKAHHMVIDTSIRGVSVYGTGSM